MTPRLAAAPPIRLRPAPACDPPYDDELDPEAWTLPVQPLLDLAPPPPPTKRAATPRSTPPPAGLSPQTRTTAARFVNTCLEILNGLRPIGQLRELACPLEAATVLSTMSSASRRLTREVRRVPQDRTGTVRIRLRRMRVCQPRSGAIEIAAVIGASGRAWAAAFRLEWRQGRWLCTAATVL